MPSCPSKHVLDLSISAQLAECCPGGAGKKYYAPRDANRLIESGRKAVAANIAKRHRRFQEYNSTSSHVLKLVAASIARGAMGGGQALATFLAAMRIAPAS